MLCLICKKEFSGDARRTYCSRDCRLRVSETTFSRPEVRPDVPIPLVIIKSAPPIRDERLYIKEVRSHTWHKCEKEDMFPERVHTIKSGSRAWKTDRSKNSRWLRYFCGTCGDRMKDFSFLRAFPMPVWKKVGILETSST